MTEPLLDNLTPAQREAVAHVHGPMLVVAGAGSGKTRVVTRRIAYLMGRGVPSWRILALTFTNKAAREMRSRVEELVGGAPSWMGTFHSVCARLLRQDLDRLGEGRDRRFSIVDQGDQESLVRQALKKLGVADKSFKPAGVLAAIANAKAHLVAPGAFAVDSWRDEVIRNAYAEYEDSLRRANALDFDDLLGLTARLLDHDAEVLERLRRRFPFILVDEYQDTNRVQYLLLRKLAGPSANIHATGDPDQSIYSWRGADYRNIMDFQGDFPGAKVVRLEQNYRSTKMVLAAANGLIRHNANRVDKQLFTANAAGERVTVAALQSDAMEAAWIAGEMLRRGDAAAGFRDMAVFYRTNAQSRPLEEAFMRAGIPYQLVGGVRFYERREIKDLLAHLKIRVNPRDVPSLGRIAGCRATGVGEKTLGRIVAAAAAAGLPPFSFLAAPEFVAAFAPNKRTLTFSRWCARLAAVDVGRADLAVREILALSGLVEEALAGSGEDELADERVDNLQSLAARAGEFVKSRLEGGAAPPPAEDGGIPASGYAVDLAAFLEDVALVADVDAWDEQSDKATLMTLHSAKGLEFPFVFIAGLEEGVLPHRNARGDEAVEEERRLFYVGLTRARRRAWVSRAELRFAYGSSEFAAPSRFLDELPDDAVERVSFAGALSPDCGAGFRSAAAGGRRGSAGGIFGDEDLAFAVAADPDFDDGVVPDPDPGLPDSDPGGGLGGGPAGWRKKPGRGPVKQAPFRPGDLVRHPAFGSGKVLTAGGGKLLVQFFASGTRLLQLELCPLTRE